jgi:hypothetical protein
METWPKEMEEEVRLRLWVEPRWRDSWRVREVMMERMGLDSMEVGEARMRMVGAEPKEPVEEEERLSMARDGEPVVLRRRESSALGLFLEGSGLENILFREALGDAGGDELGSGCISTSDLMCSSFSIGLEPPSCLEEQLPEHSDSAVLTPAACSPARGDMNMK